MDKTLKRTVFDEVKNELNGSTPNSKRLVLELVRPIFNYAE